MDNNKIDLKEGDCMGCSIQGPLSGSRGHENDLSGSMKCGEFLENFNDHHLLKKDSDL
jgi:hypothetical protein